MSFNERVGRGAKWAAQVQGLIEKRGWRTVPMGAEHVAPAVHHVLSGMKHPDPTARFVRFMPDGFAVHPTKEQAFFYDAKDSKALEKDAYNAYMAFRGHDRRVLLLINAGDKVYCVPVQSIQFLDSAQVVGQYPEDKRMPVDEDGWIAPRLWPEQKYWAWKSKNPEASGTPFRYLDLAAMARFQQDMTKLQSQ